MSDFDPRDFRREAEAQQKAAAAAKEKAAKPNSGEPPIRSRYWTLEDIEKLADPEWIVDRLIAKMWKTLSFGESGTYKSHHAVDRYCHVAHGLDYHGLATMTCPICFIANEDAYGLAVHRVEGWHKHYGKPAGRVIVIPGNVKLDRPENVETAIAAARDAFGTEERVGYVVDTWDRSLAGNPNDAAVVNPALDGLDALLAANGAFTDTISHSPWSDRERTKGPVTFWANHDTRLKHEKFEVSGRGTIKVIHHKNAAPGFLLSFEFEQFEFERQSGSSVSTIIPKRDFEVSTTSPAATKANGKARDHLTDTQHLALEALREEAETSKRWDFSFADAQAVWVRRDVIDGDLKDDQQRWRACRIRKQLAKRKLIRLENNLVRLVLPA
jgi:AAA domain